MHGFAARALAVLAAAACLGAQDAPRVVALDPPHLAADVDPATTQLTVTFDQARRALELLRAKLAR